MTDLDELSRNSFATRLLLAVDYVWWLRTILLWMFCGWMAWLMTWSIHPVSWGTWTTEYVLESISWFVAIIFLAGLSLLALFSGMAMSRPIRWTLTAQLILSLAIVLDGFVLRLLPRTFIVIAFGAPICLVLLILMPWREPAKHARLYHASILVAVLTPIAALLVWSELNIGIVGRDADRVAGGHPYCLQVPGDRLGGYAAVTSRRQLAGLRMQTPFTNGGGSGDFQFAFHAVAIIDEPGTRKFYNWSYRNQRFEQLLGRTAEVTGWYKVCEPVPGYLSTLQ